MEPSEPIVVHQRPLPETRTKERDCQWRAECTHEGKTWVEVSRAGASHELARTLKKAGLGDRQMVIQEEGRRGHLTVPSFHAWAEWTYSGGNRVRWATVQANLEALRALRE